MAVSSVELSPGWQRVSRSSRRAGEFRGAVIRWEEGGVSRSVQWQALLGGSKLRGAVEGWGESQGAVSGFVSWGRELHAVSQGGRGNVTEAGLMAHDFVCAEPLVFI